MRLSKPFISFVIFGVLFLGGMFLAASGEVQAQAAPSSLKKTPQIFTNEKRGFSIVIPPSVDVRDEKDGDRLIIRSRKGYVIKVQTGRHQEEWSDADMFFILEQQYLGIGRPWKRKIGARELQIGGLPASESLYSGPKTRSRIVIARGKKTDFIFMFFSPDEHFNKLNREFDWMLTQFKPAEDEKPARVSSSMLPRVPDNQSHTMKNLFQKKEFGFKISYPGDWITEIGNNSTVSFSGKKGGAGYDTVVTIQNVRPASGAASNDLLTQALQDFLQSIKSVALEFTADQVTAFNSTSPANKEHTKPILSGLQTLVTYQFQNQSHQKWIVVVPRNGKNKLNQVFHIWSYTAPAQSFKNSLPIAQQMLSSWNLMPN